MILDQGCKLVLIGHSERRQYFGETDHGVNTKLLKALDAGLKPMVCIGETLEQREAGDTEKVVLAQLEGGLAGIEAPGPLVLAYEPVWAIGTGKTATPDQAQEVHAVIRGWLAERFSGGEAIRVLYGGSVKPDNIAEIMSRPDVDGGLVGGASLKPGSFLGMVKNAPGS
jgi:triosephosphate isomerase